MPKRVLIVLSLMVATALPTSASSVEQASASVWPEGDGPGVRLLRSDAQGIVLELRTSDYQLVGATGRSPVLVQGTACQRIQVTGAVLGEEAGHPQLPLQIALLGVPPRADLELEVTPLQTVRWPETLTICPAPETGAEEDEDGAIRYVTREAVPDPAVYGKDRFYPSEIAHLEELGFMRSQRIVRLAVSPFQVNPLSGEVRQHQWLRVELRFKDGADGTSWVKERAEFETALKRTLLNYESARGWRGTPAQARATSAWTPPDPSYKIMVEEDGIYELSWATLAAAGLPVDTLDPRTLRLFNAGLEVAIHVSGEGDGHFDEGEVVLFYGQGVDTRYTATNVYWLTYGAAMGQRMAEKLSLMGGAPLVSFSASVHLEDNFLYISSLPMQAGANHWYGSRVQAAGQDNPGWLDVAFTLEHVATEAFTPTLDVALAGNYEGIHHLRLYVNGQEMHDDSWYGRTVYEASVEFPHSHLAAGDNVIRVELANDTPGQIFDMVYIDWLRVGYQRTTVAEGDVLAFGGDEVGTWQYSVRGFSSPDIQLFDITDPAGVRRITGAMVVCPTVLLPLVARDGDMMGATDAAGTTAMAITIAKERAVTAGGRYTLRFGDSHEGGRRYLALTEAQRLAPLSIEQDIPSQLQSPGEGADYIVITHTDFRDAVLPLAAHRAAQGLRAQVVDVQDVYDEFGYGLMSAEAIRDFLAYAYDRWPGAAPSYALLVGDGTYDFRHYLINSGPTYLPPYLEFVDPGLGEAAADNRFGCVVGDDFLPDLSVGRLPANTPAEAEVMVNKILGYETSPAAGDWNRNVLFVADDLEGGGGNFYTLSDAIADGYADPPTNTVKFLPAPYVPQKIYLGQTCPDEEPSVVCRQQILDTINTTGALLVNFIGHSTKFYWARERLMDYGALVGLTNGDKLFISLPMTCLEGYFHEAQIGVHSFGEANVRLAGGGAVASWSPSGLGVATGHDMLERGFYLALFHDGVRELGPATNQAKLYLLANSPPGRYRDIVDTYLVLGDPALRVHLAEP